VSTADPQRARVYEAEGALAAMIDRRADFPVAVAFGSRVVIPDDRKFGDLASVQRYVDAVLALGWVRDAAPRRARLPVRVRARAGATRAEYDPARLTIAVPPHHVGGRWAMRELVILHELAHHLAPQAGHGPPFVAMFLRLVEDLLAPEAGFLLRCALSDAGVSARAAPG
jgi:putative metallohydrolase (TIGR04338 family)